jgi:ribonuclease HII
MKKLIAGMDEVGRGAFAGPLMAGCVVMGNVSPPKGIWVDDSKKLTQKQRELASVWIKQNAIAWGIGKASPKYIDKFGITKAENLAFRQAFTSTQKMVEGKIELLMIDAFYVPRLKGIPQSKQFAIKKGDSKSMAVACASIIAKVERDKFMVKLSQNSAYKGYVWDKNKGYGTKAHIKAIALYGPSPLHRRLFLRNI